MRAAIALGLLVLAAAPLAAQDPIDRGVRVGITYTAGTRPRLVILPGAGLDSARAILQRDLDYSDRFEVLPLEPGGGTGAGRREVGTRSLMGGAHRPPGHPRLSTGA